MEVSDGELFSRSDVVIHCWTSVSSVEESFWESKAAMVNVREKMPRERGRRIRDSDSLID